METSNIDSEIEDDTEYKVNNDSFISCVLSPPQSSTTSSDSSENALKKRKREQNIDSMQNLVDRLEHLQTNRRKDDSIDGFCKLLNHDMRKLIAKNQIVFR